MREHIGMLCIAVPHWPQDQAVQAPQKLKIIGQNRSSPCIARKYEYTAGAQADGRGNMLSERPTKQ